jgi:hypothetical protein
MPLPPWNHVYTYADFPSAWDDRTVMGMYMAAINERLDVLSAGAAPVVGGNFIAVPATTSISQYAHLVQPVQGDFASLRLHGTLRSPNILGTEPLPGHDTFNFSWHMLQLYVELLSWWFVKSDDGDGNPIDYDGADLISSWANCQYVQFGSPFFPPHGGYTSKYPRTIATLSAPGSKDQVAWCTELTSAADNRGVVKHDGTAWQLLGQQTTDPYPDLLTTQRPSAHGDIIGPWVLNDLRDAINRLVWTMGSLSGGAGFGPEGRGVKRSSGDYVVKDVAFSSFTPGSNERNWQTTVTAYIRNPDDLSTFIYGVFRTDNTPEGVGAQPGYAYALASDSRGAKASKQIATFPSTAASYKRDIDFFSLCEDGGFVNDSNLANLFIAQFDAQGTVAKQNKWAKVASLTAQKGIESAATGLLLYPDLATRQPPNVGAGLFAIKGYVERLRCWISKWNVPGGFQYTKDKTD